mgnify:CR=1 FL=1
MSESLAILLVLLVAGGALVALLHWLAHIDQRRAEMTEEEYQENRAREAGLRVMCGGMVETRLGMTAMGHVVCALGGVEFADLDTAFLLASDPFDGGRDLGPGIAQPLAVQLRSRDRRTLDR